MPNRLIVTLLALLMVTGMATANAEITVEGVWSRATAPGLDRGAVYFELENTGRRGDQLIGVSTPRAPRAELHQTIEEGGNSRMVHTPEVRVPAEGEVVFEPGGRHVMLMGLTESLREGETFELTLELEHNGPVTLTVDVLPPTAMGADD